MSEEEKALAGLMEPFMSLPVTTPQMLATALQFILRTVNHEKSPMQEPLLKAEELCRQMGVEMRTLEYWQEHPDFPVVELVGRGKKPMKRFRRSEVEAWHDEKRRVACEMAK